MRILGFGGMAAYCIVGSSCNSVKDKLEREIEEREQPEKYGIDFDDSAIRHVDDINQPVIEQKDSIANPQNTDTDNTNTMVPSDNANPAEPEMDSEQAVNGELPDSVPEQSHTETNPNNVDADSTDSEDEPNLSSIEDDPKFAKIFKKYKKATDFTVERDTKFDPVIVWTKGGKIIYPVNYIATKEGNKYFPSVFVTLVVDSKGKHFSVQSDGSVASIPDKLFQEPEGSWVGCAPGQKYKCEFVKRYFTCMYDKNKKKHDCVENQTRYH